MQFVCRKANLRFEKIYINKSNNKLINIFAFFIFLERALRKSKVLINKY